MLTLFVRFLEFEQSYPQTLDRLELPQNRYPTEIPSGQPTVLTAVIVRIPKNIEKSQIIHVKAKKKKFTKSTNHNKNFLKKEKNPPNTSHRPITTCTTKIHEYCRRRRCYEPAGYGQSVTVGIHLGTGIQPSYQLASSTILIDNRQYRWHHGRPAGTLQKKKKI